MSEKITIETLEEDIVNVYKAGVNQGKEEILADSKYIPKTATGTGVVALDDVSEIPHDITVQLSGENVGGKQVKVYGKNLNDTQYEPYNPTIYTADVDGKIEGIKSISPNMTFMCDGVDMTVSYHESYGMQTERNRFWGGFQQNGERTSFVNSFYGSGWYDDIYNPIYPFKVANGNQMFMYSGITDTKTDIDLTYITNQANTKNVFYGSKVKNIRKIIVNERTQYNGYFTNCADLQHIKFEGVIGQDLNVSACPLDRESIDNVLDHLKQFDMTWTETTNTQWEQNADGTYPCDKIKIKFNEIPENVTEYKVDYRMGDNLGYGDYLQELFNEDGTAELPEFHHADDNSGYFVFREVYAPNDYGVDKSLYTIYEGKAPTPSHTVTFKRTAVEAAYTDTEWEAKVQQNLQKGWTISLV